MTFKEILAMAKEELPVMDKFGLANESMRTQSLLIRFLEIYRNEKAVLHSMTSDLGVIQKTRWEYYAGKAACEVYVTDPLDIRILRTDLAIYLDADSILSEAIRQIALQKEKIFFLDKILKGIDQREFSIRNAISMIKFDAGEIG